MKKLKKYMKSNENMKNEINKCEKINKLYLKVRKKDKV